MNKIQIIGNLIADPVTKTVTGGYSVTAFTVASNRKRGEVADLFNVSVWGVFGKTCQEYLTKGQKVYVDGVLAPGAYVSSDGTPRVSLAVTAETVEFLTPREHKSHLEVKAHEDVQEDDLWSDLDEIEDMGDLDFGGTIE